MAAGFYTDAKGNDKYQNFPCPIDSIGSKATAPPPKEETVKPASAPQNISAAAAAARSMNDKQPEVGMKMNDVRAQWGRPKSTRVDKSIETWYYDGPSGTSKGIRFDRTGTVLAVVDEDAPPASDE